MTKIEIGCIKKSHQQQAREFAERQKEKGFSYFGLFLHRHMIDKLNRLAARFKLRDGSYKRTWTRTFVITRAVSDLYGRMFTTTTIDVKSVLFEPACTGDNIRVGYVPIYRYLKTRFHSGPRRDLVCDTRAEALEKARRPNGELRKDFVGVLEIRYKADSKKEMEGDK